MMFVELIESLRCPRAHEESPLIASAERTVDRHIVEGMLGCPVCRAEFPIIDGAALFGEPLTPTPMGEPSAETAMRLAAFLELTDARGFAVICGRWATHADRLRRIAETALLLVNPAKGLSADVAGVIWARDHLPLAAGSARALVLDDTASPQLIQSAVQAVRAGGRVVGPASLTLPAEVLELARDDRMWVAERTAPDVPVPRLVAIKRG
jgi:uncharacterized protein YbaR (Trm112 family)